MASTAISRLKASCVKAHLRGLPKLSGSRHSNRLRKLHSGTSRRFLSFLRITNSMEFAMQEVADKVMQTYGLMKTLSAEEIEEAREVLLDFLSKRPDTD